MTRTEPDPSEMHGHPAADLILPQRKGQIRSGQEASHNAGIRAGAPRNKTVT